MFYLPSLQRNASGCLTNRAPQLLRVVSEHRQVLADARLVRNLKLSRERL